MNLRALDTLTIDYRTDSFVYAFEDGHTVTHAIQHDHLIDRVAALCRHAGANVLTVKEDKVNTPSKFTLKSHSVEALLAEIEAGRANTIHAASVNKLISDGLVEWTESGPDGFVHQLTVEGRKYISLPVAIIKPAAKFDEQAAVSKARAAVAKLQESRSNGNGHHEPKPQSSQYDIVSVSETWGRSGTQAPNLILPAPSKQEQAMRRAAYASIRWGLQRALSGGEALVPVLDGLEATDPLLSEKDGPK